MRWLLRSKIHNATVTDANPDYNGSIMIDSELIKKAGFWVGEKVLVASNSTGARLETYIIKGERGSGAICMKGPAALLIKTGEQIIIMGFELSGKPIKPKIVLVGKNNKIEKIL